jgi:hypothetical protein
MQLTNEEYMKAFNLTSKDKSAFARHLDVCKITTKMDKARRVKKFLWGNKSRLGYNNQVVTNWVTLDTLTRAELFIIKNYLANYPHSLEDEQIGWVFDLIDTALTK